MADRSCILSVAFPFAPVGHGAVGGAEVVLSQLECALAEFGYDSVVIAHAASQPRGKLYPVPVPPERITDPVRENVAGTLQGQIERALAENPVALVHMHGLDFDRYLFPAKVPVLVTLHLPLAWYPQTIWELPGNYTFVCVSESQRRSCPEAAQARVIVIGNGVPLPDVSKLRSGGRYALMLARICEEKNLHTGLDAAALAGAPAMLAGDVFPYPDHLRYFSEQIEPRLTRQDTAHTERQSEHLTRPEARFLGPVTGAAKARLLARAACLLVPSLAPETSSLVAMEALASGVPVIAMASGALPEIIEDGRTGFLIPPGSDHEAAERMAEAIRRVPVLDRALCRSVAAERFELSRMVAQYIELYATLALREPQLHTPLATGSQVGSTQRPQPHELSPELSPEPPTEVVIQTLATAAGLEAIHEEWAALWFEDTLATPFQHPAWLLPWWRQFGPDGELRALALREANDHRLLGFLPLYLYTSHEAQEQQLLLLGAGTTDYLDGIWSTPAPSLASQALTHVRHAQTPGQTAYLGQLRPCSPLLFAARSLGLPTLDAEPTSLLDLGAELPAKLRANIGRYRRRANNAGKLTFAAAASSGEALSIFNELIQFHEHRWDGRGEPGVLSDLRVQAHHQESIPLLMKADLLRFFRLALDGKTLGVLYALADPQERSRRSLYLYLIGFDPFAAELSPGTLLLHHVWEYARAEGFTTLDFLRGGEVYKHLWGAERQPTFALHL